MAPLVVIAGAGPAGLAAAAAFAQRGFDVEVHEKRAVAPDPTKDHAHSFTIVLNQKGTCCYQRQRSRALSSKALGQGVPCSSAHNPQQHI